MLLFSFISATVASELFLTGVSAGVGAVATFYGIYKGSYKNYLEY